jgi:hypothetical protein
MCPHVKRHYETDGRVQNKKNGLKSSTRGGDGRKSSLKTGGGDLVHVVVILFFSARFHTIHIHLGWGPVGVASISTTRLDFGLF